MLQKFHILILITMVFLGLIFQGCGRGDAGENGEAQKDTSEVIASDSSTVEEDVKSEKEKKDSEGSMVEYIPVEVKEAIIGDISQYLQLSANLKTEEQVVVFPEVSGIIREIRAEEGDRVEEGDTLLILDDEEKRINRDEAHLTYLEFKAAYERSIELRKQNLISKEEFDQAKFNMDRAKLAYERAELDLRRTRVLAPISGYIAKRNVNRGDLVNVQVELYSLVNPADMIAAVYIPESELPRINKDKKVLVFSDVFPEKVFNAKIKRISPIVNPTSGTFSITIGIDNSEELLKPGMFVTVRVITDVHKDVVLIPKEAVIYENDLPYVFLVKDSIAFKTPLKKGYDDNKYIEAVDLIKPGEKIVTVGQTGLKDSARVKIIDLEEVRKRAREMAIANGYKLEEQSN